MLTVLADGTKHPLVLNERLKWEENVDHVSSLSDAMKEDWYSTLHCINNNALVFNSVKINGNGVYFFGNTGLKARIGK